MARDDPCPIRDELGPQAYSARTGRPRDVPLQEGQARSAPEGSRAHLTDATLSPRPFASTERWLPDMPVVPKAVPPRTAQQRRLCPPVP